VIAGRSPPVATDHRRTTTASSPPSADDNAAAVAIALSSAAALGATPRARDIVIALFDAEEPPYVRNMGSVRFCASRADARGFHAALVLDLVGHDFALPLPDLANLLVAIGIESSSALPA
jgi:peptidase M28-like protein